ncbi:MAG: endonuclease III [Nitrospinae bacterium]|nr:endonuclease III [Nitrospinota bacterium]
MTAKERAVETEKILKKLYPGAKCNLDFTDPLELLVATVLSAQCTDERVNKVTQALFKKYRNAADYANAPIEQLEEDVRQTGFYKNKAASIRKACSAIVEKHGGKVPGSMEELTKLAGVGRKTANVVLGNAFGVPGIVVDTHVGRISQRLKLTKNSDPEKIERDLMPLVPQKDWTGFSHRMIHFGRDICQAKKPKCGQCPLETICPWEEKGKFKG